MLQSHPAVNQDPNRFAELGYCVFPAVFDAAEAEANRQLLDDATAADQLTEGRYLAEPHAKCA